MKRAFVLLSGGLDSTTCLHKAIQTFGTHSMEDVEALSIDYGQRHKKEMEYAKRTCDHLGIKHTILQLPNLSKAGTMLTDANVEVPNISYSEILGVSPTYVPFRNGSMLSALTAYAQQWVNEEMPPSNSDAEDYPEAAIYFGAHSEDAMNWAYPDCTPEFIGAMANAIYIGTYRAVRLITPLQWMMKHEIVTLGRQLGVDFSMTWSCYKGEELHCGTCPTCRSRREAFVKAAIWDPTEYAA